MTQPLNTFIRQLKKSPANSAVFNPWYDVDLDNDRNKKAPLIRRQQLTHYLEQRLKSARYLLIAEAVGYQGAHFSGIAMTSERILLGHQAGKGILPTHVFTDIEPQRTSRLAVKPNGFTEPTATIVWGAILELGLDPYACVHWNGFPWHPYQPAKGLLSNRTPTPAEYASAIPTLHTFINLFPHAKILAVGQKCAASLTELNIPHGQARHPANGGATLFKTHFKDFIDETAADLR